MNIKKGEVVYFDNFKFGIVISINSSQASIYFPLENRPFNFPLKNVNSLNNKKVVDNLTIYDVFHLNLLDYFFPIKIRSRARSYANDYNIDLFIDDENEVRASISGSDLYDTSITFDDNVISLYCTCPYEGDCKHLYALILYIKEKHKISNFAKEANLGRIDLNYLNNNSYIYKKGNKLVFNNKNIFINPSKYSQKIQDFIKNINNSPTFIDVFKKIKEFCELNNDSEIIELLTLLNDKNVPFYFKSKDYFSILKYFVSYNENILDIIDQNIIKNKHITSIKETLFPLNDTDITSPVHNLNNSLIYSLFNENYKNLKLVVDEMSNFNFELREFYKSFLYYSLEFISLNESNFNYLLDNANDFNLIILYNRVENEIDKNKVLAKLIKIKDFDYEKYSSYFNIKTIKKLFELSPYQTTTISLISAFKESLIKNDEILFLITKFFETSRTEHNFDLTHIKRDLWFYFRGKNIYLEYLFDSFFKDSQEKTVTNLNKYFEDIEEKEIPQKFSDYFDINYEINNSILSMFITIKNSDIIVFKLNIEGKNLWLKSEFSSYQVTDEIISFIKMKYKDELPTILEEFNKINYEKICEEENKLFLYKLNSIYEKFFSEDELKNKVKIIPEFNKKHEFYQLKIGINSFYSQKNVTKFLSYITNKSNHKYGKNLEFVHKLSNFDENSQRLIEYLLFNQDSLYNYDLNFLSNPNYFPLLKGSHIYIEEILYKITLNPIDIKIKINEDGDLRIDKLPSQYEIFKSGFPFLINKIDQTIDIYTDNKIINNLIPLIISAPFTNISKVFDEFKYKFYLSNEKYFEIDKAIVSKFKKHSLIIESYIDLNDDKLTLTTKYIKNNEEITSSYLFNQNDNYLLSFYSKLINKYGFENGEISDSHLIRNFLNSELTDLKEISQIYFSDSILNKKIYQFKKPGIKINYQSNLLDILLEESKYSDEELLEIISSIKKKKSFVLINNEIICLENSDATNFKNIVDDFSLISNKKIEKNKELPLYYVFKNLEVLEDKNNKVIDELYEDIKNFKTKDFEIPSFITASLRDYQKEGYYWLKVLYKYNLGGILADDMGLGKTLEIITFLTSLNISKPILIVTPTSLIYNWINEFEKFSNENIEINPIYGSINERENIIKNIDLNKKAVYLTSYESLRNDIKKYENIGFDILILDEAQFIKNVDALKTKSVKKIKAKNKFVLTGTPIENSIIDLWSIFDFLMSSFLPPLNEFKSSYESDENYKNEIKRKIAPFILRRNKNDVLKDLPDKYEILLTCEMNKEQQKIYDAEIFKAREKMKETTNTFDILPTLTRLRQICIDPSLYIDKYEGGSEKINTLINCIKEEISSNNKVLVFSQFVGALNIIKDKLNKGKITYGIIKGDTKSQERLKIAQDFNFNDAYDVLLVSLKAGGTGLNLIGANVVIHLDPWWNYAIEEQASDRAYRIGQTRNVKVLKLIVNNSIEQRVLELQKIKKEVANSIISNDDSSITNLKKEDILYILGKE